MRKLAIAFFIVVVSIAVSSAQTVQEKLGLLMDDYAVKSNFNGSVIVARKGVVLLERGYGYRNMEKQTRNDEHTIYRIGQNTEEFTAEMIVQMDSKGQLGLDDRVTNYVPDFPLAAGVTIKQLLAHTSGIPRYVPDTTMLKGNVCRPVNRETFIEYFNGRQLSFDPGMRYEYSNTDYILLGFVIEKVTKVRPEHMINFRFFQVCGMKHSGFSFAELKDNEKATGYYYLPGDQTPLTVPANDTEIMYSANAMYSTVGDLYKWHEALHRYRLLPADWQSLPYMPVKGQVALGWRIEKMYNRKFMESEGSYSGYTGAIIRQEEDDVFIAVLENRMQQGYQDMDVAKSILKILYGPEPKKPAAKADHKETNEGKEVKEGKEPKEAKHVQEKEPEPVPDIPIKKILGRYSFSDAYALEIKLLNNELVVESPDKEPIGLIRQGPAIFKTAGADVRFEFVPDKKGNITKVILHQDGQDHPGKRLK